MHIYNSYIRNGDHFILLIKTGMAHKQDCCHKLPLILLKMFGVEIKTRSKLMVAAKWWLFF